MENPEKPWARIGRWSLTAAGAGALWGLLFVPWGLKRPIPATKHPLLFRAQVLALGAGSHGLVFGVTTASFLGTRQVLFQATGQEGPFPTFCAGFLSGSAMTGLLVGSEQALRGGLVLALVGGVGEWVLDQLTSRRDRRRLTAAIKELEEQYAQALPQEKQAIETELETARRLLATLDGGTAQPKESQNQVAYQSEPNDLPLLLRWLPLERWSKEDEQLKDEEEAVMRKYMAQKEADQKAYDQKVNNEKANNETGKEAEIR
jgi:hypothetical protein